MVGGDFNLDASRGDAAGALRAFSLKDAVGSPEIPTTPPHGLLENARPIDWILASDTTNFRGQVHNRPITTRSLPRSCAFDGAPLFVACLGTCRCGHATSRINRVCPLGGPGWKPECRVH